jgi:hypothetical protein
MTIDPNNLNQTITTASMNPMKVEQMMAVMKSMQGVIVSSEFHLQCLNTL